jgi:hypothetical protein
MHTWFCKNLGDAMLAYDELEEIKELFFLRYKNMPICNDIAIFIRHESEGHLQCEVKLYFSPKLEHFANELDAIACAKPRAHSLGLFIGSDKSRNIFF